jgi:hypothetical protein
MRVILRLCELSSRPCSAPLAYLNVIDESLTVSPIFLRYYNIKL